MLLWRFNFQFIAHIMWHEASFVPWRLTLIPRSAGHWILSPQRIFNQSYRTGSVGSTILVASFSMVNLNTYKRPIDIAAGIVLIVILNRILLVLSLRNRCRFSYVYSTQIDSFALQSVICVYFFGGWVEFVLLKVEGRRDWAADFLLDVTLELS